MKRFITFLIEAFLGRAGKEHQVGLKMSERAWGFTVYRASQAEGVQEWRLVWLDAPTTAKGGSTPSPLSACPGVGQGKETEGRLESCQWSISKNGITVFIKARHLKWLSWRSSIECDNLAVWISQELVEVAGKGMKRE